MIKIVDVKVYTKKDFLNVCAIFSMTFNDPKEIRRVFESQGYTVYYLFSFEKHAFFFQINDNEQPVARIVVNTDYKKQD